jgi:antitoxin CcdA
MGKAELRLEIDAALLAQARAAGLAIAPVVEQALRDALPPAGIAAANARQNADLEGAEARARKWAEDNAEAIEAYNERIRTRGVFGADLRRW